MSFDLDIRAALSGSTVSANFAFEAVYSWPDQMWASMQKLMALPADTTICSGHEYTASNAKFALTVDPANAALISRSNDIQAARDKGLPTVPSKLSTELETNPFLRPADPGIRATLGMQDATDAAVFTEIRKRKDSF